jgi:hypothetical protein
MLDFFHVFVIPLSTTLWTGLGQSVTLAFLMYHHLTREYRRWENTNVATIKPTFPFGNTIDMWKGTRTIFDLHQEFQEKHEGERYKMDPEKRLVIVLGEIINFTRCEAVATWSRGAESVFLFSQFILLTKI